MKKYLVLIIMLILIIPINIYAQNDSMITCDKVKINLDEEVSCNLWVNNLNFTALDITGKVVTSDNLVITSSSYDKNIWLSLDNTFNIQDINLVKQNNNKVDNLHVATFTIRAKSESSNSFIKFANISLANENYESVVINDKTFDITFTTPNEEGSSNEVTNNTTNDWQIQDNNEKENPETGLFLPLSLIGLLVIGIYIKIYFDKKNYLYKIK